MALGDSVGSIVSDVSVGEAVGVLLCRSVGERSRLSCNLTGGSMGDGRVRNNFMSSLLLGGLSAFSVLRRLGILCENLDLGVWQELVEVQIVNNDATDKWS